MKTKTPNATGYSTDSGNRPAAAIFTLLRHGHRRYVLRYLSQTAGSASLGDLAARIAEWEGDQTHERYERILIGLHHAHLPKLAEAGVVRYDVEQETIELANETDRLTRYLDLAMAEDTS